MSLSSDQLDHAVRELKFTIQLRPETTVRKFETFAELIEFLTKEHEFWASLAGAPKTGEFRNAFQELRTQIAAVPGRASDARQAMSLIEQTLQIERRKRLIYSATPQAVFLKRLAEHYGNGAADGALMYFKNEFESPHSQPVFLGMLSAALFQNPELFAGEVDVLKQSMSAAFTAGEKQREDLNRECAAVVKEHTSFMDDARQFLEQSKSQAEGDFALFRTSALENTNAQAAQFTTAMQGWTDEISNLQKAYNEHLKLKQPAEYWEELRQTYWREGMLFAKIALFIGVVIAGLIGLVLYIPPESFVNAAGKFTTETARTYVLGAIGLSTLLYVMNLTVRLSTSALHLSRDARERHQLTLVYLALIKDAAVDEKDRAVVLQSLFSRADTGLLKGDSGPTMPGPLANLAELLKNR